jgi:hypothetical protein
MHACLFMNAWCVDTRAAVLEAKAGTGNGYSRDPTCLETSLNAGDERSMFDPSSSSLHSVCHGEKQRRTLIQLRPAEAMGSASVGDILPT